MEAVQVLSVSDLLRRRRPISGAVSLLPSPPPPPPPSDSKTINPNTKTIPSTKILNSHSHPSIIVGTFSLQSSNDCPHLCFSFSDDSGSLCCDVLQFDFRMVRRKIRVLAWNFIPFKQCGGLLEIIRWEFVEGFNSGNAVDSFPLVFDDNNGGNDYDKKAKYSVYGILGSVSPVSSIPCSNESLRGFILEILCCDCRLCKFKNGVENFDDLGLGHNFCKTEYVYFCGVCSFPYPMFLKLEGRLVLLLGLRKKIVYIGKEESQLMFVATEMTRFRVPNSEQKEDYSFRSCKARIKGKWELGVYIGVVRSIYMQGMVVELDEDVWLLLTDESLLLPHSVRVGSILSVKNVHIVNPEFPWGKMLILGVCCKTNISVISFSPLETRCQPVARSQSLLGTFMESLVFPARLWVLLLVQCLRKKISGVFSEMEILGTKHKEGLVQTYARAILPSSVLQSRHGIFMEFCKHDSCGSGSNIYYGNLSLAMPFSYLVNTCERMGIKSLLQVNNGLEFLEGCSQVGHPLTEAKLSDQPIRRILRSKDIGVSLLGNLKVCPATGRLQYIDGAGSIDAVIPDIPSAWDRNAIYEVFDFSLVLEGMPETWDQMLGGDLFSCGTLFETLPIKRRTMLTVYVHFSWSNVSSKHFSVHPCLSAINSFANLDPGTFHLLQITHKFPLQPRFHGDLSGKGLLFAEVMVLPWDLNIGMSDRAALLTKLSQDDLEKGCQNGSSLKRCKTHQISSCVDKVGSCSNFEECKKRSFDQRSSLQSLPHKTRNVNKFSGASLVQFPCTITAREIQYQHTAIPAILCYTDGNRDMLCSRSSRKVLLEFNSENFFKYKFLEIGGSYIMKHCAEKCLCDSRHINLGSNIIVTSETNFWSLSFNFGEVAECMSGPCNDSSSVSCSISRLNHQNELALNRCGGVDNGICSDVDLHVTVDATGLLDANMGVQALKKLLINLSWKITDISSIDSIHQQVGCGNTVTGHFENQGMCSGNGLPVGNLISLQGTVVSLHNSYSCSIDRVPCNEAAQNFHLPRFNKEKERSINLFVLSDGHSICGSLSKFDFPVGLGPGAVAIFHRILALSGHNCFMLTPVSFITVNSVREVPTPAVKSLCPIPEETIASCLISDLIHCDTGQPRRLRCSIVSVYFVMLERNKNLDKLLPRIQLGTPVVNIPLAGFILDDGSSHCCCWTSGERAATFLRLTEEIPQAKRGSSSWRLKAAVRNRAFSTSSYQLDRILKKHERLSVKNYGSIYDTSCQDIQLSVGSDCTFGSQDENLLKVIMFNACSSRYWTVIGHAMDSNAVNILEKNLLEEHMTLHPLQNVWASEVSEVNPLAQAKALFQDLKSAVRTSRNMGKG
ncbi:CST complex subunit CTC1 isoform X2 [Spinacia oleracea]|uniref:CST complex subunit CTC1 n=1 Tax=Spinacia oleracea TaxID=3562 RepID=A0ABM3RFI8_SPIOL|nr:CST complex subunit CTC1 isoform X2 [Spinacia oleracea]